MDASLGIRTYSLRCLNGMRRGYASRRPSVKKEEEEERREVGIKIEGRRKLPLIPERHRDGVIDTPG